MNATPEWSFSNNEVVTVHAVWSVTDDTPPALAGLYRDEGVANEAAVNEFAAASPGIDAVTVELDSSNLVDTGYFNAKNGLADDESNPTVLVFVEPTVLL